MHMHVGRDKLLSVRLHYMSCSSLYRCGWNGRCVVVRRLRAGFPAHPVSPIVSTHLFLSICFFFSLSASETIYLDFVSRKILSLWVTISTLFLLFVLWICFLLSHLCQALTSSFFGGWGYGISTFVGYLTPNPFLCKKSVLFKTIQFSISTQFNCQKHFYFKLFKQLYVTIQLSVNTVLMSKKSSISNNSVKHKHAV